MDTTPLWVPLAAALGASTLTGLTGFGIAVWQARRRAREALQERRREAYSALIATSGVIAHSAWMLRLAQKVRTGVAEGVDIALRLRKPLDPLELHDWMRKDIDPLYGAWSQVWTIGSAQAVGLANDLVGQAGNVVGVATSEGQARGVLGRRLLGEKWSAEQEKALMRAVDELTHTRAAFAALAREETGVEIAPLLGESQR